MKKILTLMLVLTGCASNNVTLQDLMRESYYAGCVDTKKILKNAINEFGRYDMYLAQERCKDSSESFDPYDTGIYDDSMEMRYKPTPHEILNRFDR